jgi:hypothetical protein
VLDEMYPSRPKRECVTLSFFSTVLAMAVEMAMVMLEERTRICSGSRVRDYPSCPCGMYPIGPGRSFLP